MITWKIWEIKVNDDYIDLISHVKINYSDGSTNSISVANKSPFNTLKVGDVIHVNDYELANNYSRRSIISSEDIVSKVKF